MLCAKGVVEMGGIFEIEIAVKGEGELSGLKSGYADLTAKMSVAAGLSVGKWVVKAGVHVAGALELTARVPEEATAGVTMRIRASSQTATASL